MGCCEFCIYAETDSQNEWNQQANDESDSDDNEDESDTVDMKALMKNKNN